jgi:hypothetical protein
VVPPRSPAPTAFVLALALAAPGVQAGNLDRFASVPGGPREESLPHPVCGLAAWNTAPDPQTGELLRFPRFHRCRHLLTILDWRVGPDVSPGERLLAEVIFLIIDRTMPPALASLGPGPPVNLAVQSYFTWIPAGCEEELAPGQFVVLAPERLYSVLRPATHPPDWALCQNRFIELFVTEYQRHPNVVLFDRLSATLDALNLDKAQDLHRLHRVRLLLMRRDQVPSLFELLGALEANPLPQYDNLEIGSRIPFRVEADPSQPMTFAARGTVDLGLATSVQIEEAILAGC